MTIYNLYIYDGSGACLIYRSWNQQPMTEKAIKQRCVLTFGLVYSMKGFCNKVTPVAPRTHLDVDSLAMPGSFPSSTSDIDLSIAGLTLSPSSHSDNALNVLALTAEQEQPRAITTPDYKIIYWETMSGLRLVLVTDPRSIVPMGLEVLKRVYAIYADAVVKAPDYAAGPPSAATAAVFDSKLTAFLQTVAFFG